MKLPTFFGIVGANSVLKVTNAIDFILSLTMAPHITTEMCEHMVVWRSELGKTDTEIAALSGCSEHAVHEVLQLHHEYALCTALWLPLFSSNC